MVMSQLENSFLIILGGRNTAAGKSLAEKLKLLKGVPISIRSLASESAFAMILKIFTVDAFSDQPFQGNPAAVVPLTENLPDSIMQKIAFEMNLSETAFVTAPSNTSSPWTSSTRFGLRWFTPTNEVPLCGHATLASAHTLFKIFDNPAPSLEFETLSGCLLARKQDGGIILDFPANPPSPIDETQRRKFEALVHTATGGAKVQDIQFSPRTGKLLIRMDDSYTRGDLEAIQTKTSELLKVNDGSEVRGVIVTLLGGATRPKGPGGATDSDAYHFISRYFAPWVGIPEDPVTGSAHTVLGPYWSKLLGMKQLTCRQCSPRGGDLRVTLRDDGRVDIFGRATTFLQGEIHV